MSEWARPFAVGLVAEGGLGAPAPADLSALILFQGTAMGTVGTYRGAEPEAAAGHLLIGRASFTRWMMLLHNFQDPDGIGLDSSHTNHRLSTSQASCWPMLVVLLFVLFGSVQLPQHHRSAVVQLPLGTVGVGTSHPSPITSAPYPSHHSRIRHRPTMISQPCYGTLPRHAPKAREREPLPTTLLS